MAALGGQSEQSTVADLELVTGQVTSYGSTWFYTSPV
jgi:hypothetical protein